MEKIPILLIPTKRPSDQWHLLVIKLADGARLQVACKDIEGVIFMPEVEGDS